MENTREKDFGYISEDGGTVYTGCNDYAVITNPHFYQMSPIGDGGTMF